ncbi:IS3 family transposase [Streptomyces sp. NBC_00289]|uniref:IS3 family transposase n=1 Tax=Streptomyces sp. NBC_00289 TaxID=2975703 RepID=UPI003254E74F
MQAELHRWAAADKRRRFDDLFNFVHDPATPIVAFDRVAGNRAAGTADVDGLAAADVETRIGVPGLLRALRAQLKTNGIYGLPHITAELRNDGENINHQRVARVMRSVGLAGLRLRKRHRTTIRDPAHVTAADLITAEHPNTKYVGDLTYLPVSGAKPL